MNDSTKNDSSTENDELFCFETDHLALKGNPEYSELLKTMFTLEAQRQRAIDVSTFIRKTTSFIFRLFPLNCQNFGVTEKLYRF